MFPSPCGDMVLKLCAKTNGEASATIVSVPLRGYGFEMFLPQQWSQSRRVFPSPCGDMVLKLLLLRSLMYVFYKEFPSPCGDMVLKYSLTITLLSFVCNMVSVPLRGYGFEIFMDEMLTAGYELFPSPCGDMVLKFRRVLLIRPLKFRFPSPCGDMVLKCR